MENDEIDYNELSRAIAEEIAWQIEEWRRERQEEIWGVMNK